MDDAGRETMAFRYHKSLSPMHGLLLGIALAETLTVHVGAMAVWGWRVALVLLAIDVSAVIAWPYVVIDLKAPIGTGWRQVAAVAHRLNDPEAFHAALAAQGVVQVA